MALPKDIKIEIESFLWIESDNGNYEFVGVFDLEDDLPIEPEDDSLKLNSLLRILRGLIKIEARTDS